MGFYGSCWAVQGSGFTGSSQRIKRKDRVLKQRSIYIYIYVYICMYVLRVSLSTLSYVHETPNP